MHFTPLNITSAKKKNLYIHSVHFCSIVSHKKDCFNQEKTVNQLIKIFQGNLLHNC